MSLLKRTCFLLALLLVLPPGVARSATAKPDAFAALVAAAKAEGSVVVDGPAVDAVRAALTHDFEAAYGIPVSYIASGGGQSGVRVRAERAAGKYLLDVFISGSDPPLLTFLPAGWLDPIEPVLVAPDVTNPRKWTDGHLWWGDPQHTVLRVFRFIAPQLAINTKLVKPNDVATWQNLLDPKWQGKIIAKDPTIDGPGSTLNAYFYLNYGADFVRKFYKDQRPVLSRDPRQSMQWLAEGSNPILVGPDFTALRQFQQLGYPVVALSPQGAAFTNGGWGMIALMNRAPHPNAAKLFVNWLAGKQGQESFANSVIEVSLRTDVAYTNVPAELFPQKNRKYVDFYEYKFVTEQRGPALEKVRALLNQ